MSYRPLALVSGLTLGDYLLWNWSLNANHDVLALVSGLTLPPLALACAWMIALTLIRLVGGTTRRSARAAASGRGQAAARQAVDARADRTTPATGAGEPASAATAAQPSSSGKLAA